MAFSVDGLVSGLDTTSIVKQLIDIQRRPITLLEKKQASLIEQKTAWQEVSTRLLALESSAGKFNTASVFASRSSKFLNNNSNGGSVLSVSAGGDVANGAYDIVVSQLAKAEKSSSNETFSSQTSAISSSGTITITPNGQSATNITVGLTDSLADIRDAINNSSAADFVTATIINSGTLGSPAYRLVVTSDNTGSDNSFTITDATDAAQNLSFTESQTAQNATFTLDNISITKSSNTVSDVIDGATIELETIGSGSITFATDTAAILEKVQDFADKYNEVMDYIKEQFTYNQDQNSKGALFGNGSLETIQAQLQSIVSGVVPGMDVSDSTEFAYLSQIGIKTDDLDHLVIDEADFNDALRDRFTDVQNLFAPAGSGTYTFVAADGFTTGGTYDTQVIDSGGGVAALQMRLSGTTDWITLTQSGNFVSGPNDTDLEGLLLRTGTLNVGDPAGSMQVSVGIAERVASFTAKYTEHSTEGLIFNQNDAIEDHDKEIQIQIDDLEERLAKREEDLKARFVNLETLLAQLSSEQSYLNSQLSTLSKGWK